MDYEILDDSTVILRKAKPFDSEYYEALTHTLNEWMTKEDEEAYRDL